MRDRLAELGFSGVVPVFPLPDVVLFPSVRRPFHIFEPRYRALTRDAWSGEKLLAVATLLPGWERDYEGAPAFHPLATVARIAELVELPDGRFDLLLEGLERVRLEEEFTDRPYRMARAQVLGDEPVPEGDSEVAELGQRLLLTYGYLTQIRMHPEAIVSLEDPAHSFEHIVHTVCQDSGVEVADRLRALEAAGPLERAGFARVWLARALDEALAKRGLPRLAAAVAEAN